MTNLQVDYFLSVANTKSVSRAAEELFVTPPAVSKQIALLEQELDLKLFLRGVHGMELTPGGEIMYSHFLSERAGLETALQRARDVGSNPATPLHLGIMQGWQIQPQIAQLRSLLRAMPSPVELIPHSLPYPAQPDRLERGELDAALCISSDLYTAARTTELHITPITKVKKLLLFSSRLPLASKPDLVPADLSGLPCLTFSPDPQMNVSYDNLRLCASLGFTPQIILRYSHEDVLFDVGMGSGFTVGDEWMEKRALPGYASITVPDTHTVCLIWPAYKKDSALQALESYCVDQIDWTARSPGLRDDIYLKEGPQAPQAG